MVAGEQLGCPLRHQELCRGAQLLGKGESLENDRNVVRRVLGWFELGHETFEGREDSGEALIGRIEHMFDYSRWVFAVKHAAGCRGF
ncbi:MAG: hypothetical protein WB592_10415 [Acidimicrobiales bacterium]